MANMREIQDRMKSIQDTMKITNAMYMISSSKMKRAQKILKDTEPYYFAMQDAIGRVLRHVPDIEHIYFESESGNREEKNKKIGYIVVTGDKGLAGAYNHNILKIAEEQMAKPGEHRLFVLGELGRHYFAKKNADVDTSFRYTVQNPTLHRARSIGERVIGLYRDGELDEIHIIFTEMNSAVAMEARMLQLLPLKKATFRRQQLANIAGMHNELIEMNPSAEAVLNSLVPNYVIGMIYGCLVESYSSEHNSRMMAMESSTKSAGEMLHDLSILYNRARQAAITQEITEVISGARAQKGKAN
ncbi:MAG TPA: ATP synthase F1 subunit gamma [Candidatus Egerieimonas faecigallinarum]|nr:ATP synthase F1 subunit gamma [Candidatus Egerieimonas faecigallinarum]